MKDSRSAGENVNRARPSWSRTIAIKYEDAAREADAGRFIESRARKVIADIYTLANTEVLPNSNTRAFLQVWLNRKRPQRGA
jgi:hypothetical protein